MALVVKDRVQETTGVTGTGTMTLGGAVSGFQAFSVIGTGNVTYYAVVDVAAGMWEVGYGTYTASGTTLTRTFVYDSSNAGALVNFAAGTKNVFCTYPADQAIYQELDGSLKLVGGQITLTLDGTLGTTLPNSTFQAFSTTNTYIQTNQQNLSSGALASSNTVLTANNGTDTTNYVDLGMTSSGYNDPTFPALLPNSGFLVSTGADLRIQAGTNGATSAVAKDIVFTAGLLTLAGERMRIKGLTGNIIFDGDNPADTGEKIQVVGSAKITGATEFQSTVLLSANPTLNLQATTKQYVDSAVATGFVVHDPVTAATNAAAGVIYNNGASGVGATMTADTNRALIVDGATLVIGSRVLFKQQVSSFQNGVYTITALGSGSTPWVVTRATDFDQVVAGEVANNAYFFVNSGTVNNGRSFVLSQLAAITIGTTDLPFTLFADQLVYTGTAPINVTGQTIALTGVVPVANGGTNLSSYVSGDLLYSTGATTLSRLAVGSTGQALIVTAGAPFWGALDMAGVGVTGSLPATKGGTGQSAYAVGDTLYSSATNTLIKLPGNTTTTKRFLGQTGTGSASAAPIWQQPAAGDITGLAASATTDTTNAANITTGTLPSARISGSYTGLTGTGALAAGSLASGFTAVSAPLGGTGQTSYAVGDLLFASTTTALSKLADIAVGNALISGGLNAAPSYGKIGLATHVSGTLPVSNGGTGVTSSTGSVAVVLSNSPTLVTPALGTPTALVGTNITGTASGLTAGNVTTNANLTGGVTSIGNAATVVTNANLTGAITSSGNATSLGSFTSANLAGALTDETGSGANVFADSPTLSGTPLAPTATAGTNTTQIATTAFVQTELTADLATATPQPLGTATVGTSALKARQDHVHAMPTLDALANTTITSNTAGEILEWNGTAWINQTLAEASIADATTSIIAGNGLSGGGTLAASRTLTLGTPTTITSATTNSVGATTHAHALTVTASDVGLGTTGSVQFGSLGVGTVASGVTGEIRATGSVTASFSDDRLKTKLGNIPDALAKVLTLNGFYYEANELAQSYGYEKKLEVGVSAQQVQAVQPEVVAPAPIDDNYLTVRYERLVPLLIEAIKELNAKLDALKNTSTTER